MIRVLVVDDHAIVRQGLVRLLATASDIEVSGTAANGNEALHSVCRERPDVVLMDVGMPVLDGVGATRLIVGHDPRIRVLLLTATADARLAEALGAGAWGYLLKDAAVDEVLDAVRRAAAGEDGTVAMPGSPAGLSAREGEVLAMLAAGRTTREIADLLGISDRTVHAHLSRVYGATGAADRVQAAVWGREHLTASRC